MTLFVNAPNKLLSSFSHSKANKLTMSADGLNTVMISHLLCKIFLVFTGYHTKVLLPCRGGHEPFVLWRFSTHTQNDLFHWVFFKDTSHYIHLTFKIFFTFTFKVQNLQMENTITKIQLLSSAEDS